MFPKKFKIGDMVLFNPTKMGDIFGEKTGAYELYHPIDKNGKFIRGANNVKLDDIKSIATVTPLENDQLVIKFVV